MASCYQDLVEEQDRKYNKWIIINYNGKYWGFGQVENKGWESFLPMVQGLSQRGNIYTLTVKKESVKRKSTKNKKIFPGEQ